MEGKAHGVGEKRGSDERNVSCFRCFYAEMCAFKRLYLLTPAYYISDPSMEALCRGDNM